jgi:hypothetical protein
MGFATSFNPSCESCFEALRFARNGERAATDATQRPDGQIAKSLSSPLRKNKSLNVSGKSVVRLRASHPTRGAGRDRHERAVGCGGRNGHERRTWQVAYGEVVWSWRPGAGAKFASFKLADDGGKKAGHRGEREVSRNPSRRESRIASAGPVCSCAHFFVHIAHETAGAARIRLSLRPLLFGRVKGLANLGRIAPRECGHVSPPLFDIRIKISRPSLRGALATICPPSRYSP